MNNTAFRTGGYGRLSLPALGLLAALIAGFLAAPATAAENGFNTYVQRNLVSDGSIPADHTDPKLIAPWGIAPSPTGLLWIASNGNSASTIYDDQGKSLLEPPLALEIPGGSPTGIVGNEGADFALSYPDGTTEPSLFIFATEAGIISGWSQRAGLANAIAVVDNSASGAMYKGIAIAVNDNGRFLYVTDFHGAKVDVFDSGFNPVHLPAGAFKDPDLPLKYAPFGIQNIKGNLYVTYAKQDNLKEDSVAGPGRGFVNIFDANGRLVRRLASRGHLNAPWGMALAPASFGVFGNQLLVANSGDGKINVYNPSTGEYRGEIRDIENNPMAIEGLWGICFGKGSQSANALFFTAGPAYENKGLYGRIEHAEKLFAAGSTAHETQPGQQPIKGTAGDEGERLFEDKDRAFFDSQDMEQRDDATDYVGHGGLDIHAPRLPY